MKRVWWMWRRKFLRVKRRDERRKKENTAKLNHFNYHVIRR